MKKNILHFIKIILALFLFLQVGEVSAQTITFSGGGGAYPFDALAMTTACGITKPTPGTGTLNVTALIATANVPVTSMSFLVASIGGNGKEIHFFDALGITNETVSVPAACASLITVGEKVNSYGISVGNTLGTDVIVTRVTVSSVTPFTQVKMVCDPTSSGATIITSSAEATACNAGSTAPSLTATTLANTCPSNKVNLNSLLSSSATAAQVSMLKWFTDATHTTAVADPTQAPAGSYYAFYYDATNNCYSPATGPVTATVAACCPTTSPTVN